MPVRLGDLAERFGCELVGDPDVSIGRVGTLASAGPDTLTFIENDTYLDQLPATKAGVVIMRADKAAAAPCPVLIHDNPYATYARIAAVVCPPTSYAPGVHDSAVLADSAKVAESAHVAPNAVIESGATIGEGAYIGPGAVIGPHCTVGKDSRVLANATLVRQVTTGERCIFHSGCVIGADGFGNAMTPEGWVKVPQLGGVRIGNDVEIGSSTTVDCGAIEDTVIGNGVRLDNQIQIGHNVRVGDHTAMATGVAVAGSAIIGKRCMFAGMVGVNGHIEICDDVTFLGKAMVSKSITEPGTYASNFPVEDSRTWNRRVASLRRLDKLQARIRELEKKSQ